MARRRFVLPIALAAAVLAVVPAGAGAEYENALFDLEHRRGLKSFVRQVSNPTSPRYRDYAGVANLVRRFGASPADRRATLRWVERAGGRGRAVLGRYVVAELPGRAVRRDDGVPPALRGRVDSVSRLDDTPGAFAPATSSVSAGDDPVYDLPAEHGSIRPRSGTPAGCEEGQNAGFAAPFSAFTPNQYLSAYRHAALHERGIRGGGGRVAVVEIDGFERSDVETFASCFGIELPPLRLHLAGIEQPLPPGDETTLDLEVLSAAAPGLEAIDVHEGGSSMADIFFTSAQALGEAGRRPQVISISLIQCEPTLTGQRDDWRALNNVFAIAAGAGITTLVAAGDQGSSSCTQRPTALPLLATDFPASSEYVTAVGGTNLVLDEANRITDQIAWGDAPAEFGGGGGGVSLLTGAPWWQRGISDKVSGGARAVPDVSGLADILPGYAIHCSTAACEPSPGEEWTAIGGTSAATPLLAGGIALANQVARRAGQPPLGAINPLFNHLGTRGAASEVFWDVRSGSNDLGVMIDAGGNQPLGCCSAKRGYDLASGWGSPYVTDLASRARRAYRDRPEAAG